MPDNYFLFTGENIRLYGGMNYEEASEELRNAIRADFIEARRGSADTSALTKGYLAQQAAIFGAQMCGVKGANPAFTKGAAVEKFLRSFPQANKPEFAGQLFADYRRLSALGNKTGSLPGVADSDLQTSGIVELSNVSAASTLEDKASALGEVRRAHSARTHLRPSTPADEASHGQRNFLSRRFTDSPSVKNAKAAADAPYIDAGIRTFAGAFGKNAPTTEREARLAVKTANDIFADKCIANPKIFEAMRTTYCVLAADLISSSGQLTEQQKTEKAQLLAGISPTRIAEIQSAQAGAKPTREQKQASVAALSEMLEHTLQKDDALAAKNGVPSLSETLSGGYLGVRQKNLTGGGRYDMTPSSIKGEIALWKNAQSGVVGEVDEKDPSKLNTKKRATFYDGVKKTISNCLETATEGDPYKTAGFMIGQILRSSFTAPFSLLSGRGIGQIHGATLGKMETAKVWADAAVSGKPLAVPGMMTPPPSEAESAVRKPAVQTATI